MKIKFSISYSFQIHHPTQTCNFPISHRAIDILDYIIGTKKGSKVGNHARVGANKGMPPGDLGDLDFYIGGKSLPDEKTPTNGIGGMRECSSNPFGLG